MPVVKRRWNYGRIAENAAILGAHVSGLGLPIAAGMNLYRALRSEGTPAEDKAFVERFLNGIDAWCQSPDRRQRIDRLGGLSPGWQERLADRVGEEPVVERPAAIALLAKELFTPLIESPELRHLSEELLGELVDQLPELVVNAGDRYRAFAALRAVMGADISRLEALVATLDPARRRVGDRALVTAYLTKLADRLNIDNWSIRQGADRALLDTIQQRLTLASPAKAEEGPVDVDELVERCQRIVILGGPGSGKSWSARHAAIRSAKAALAQLDRLGDDQDIAGVELPLLATCAEVVEPRDQQRWDRLVTAGLRRAAIAPRQARRLDEILADHRRFLIVLDGLDEAALVENDAIHELIDTHPGTVRILLTSRPGSWNPALLRIEDQERHRCGTLEPFTPEDRDAAVAAWLDDFPDTRDRLLALLQPDTPLSRQAQVPLICALYCLVARPAPTRPGDPFDLFAPGRRLDLYDTAIRKLLAATWRDRTTTPPTGPQVKAAIDWLKDLAQTGNITNEETGLGQWPDTIAASTDPAPAISAYVDNVAPPDPYNDQEDQTRRFIHRSLREHLTATALGRLPPAERATTILQHLWFDPDWSEVIPTLLAGPTSPTEARDHDEFIDHVTCHETVTDDPTHALDKMLLKAAACSRPQPRFTPRRDTAIEQAIQATCARNHPHAWGVLTDAAHWPATNTAREQLLELLAAPDIDPGAASRLAEALGALAPAGPQAQRGAERVLALLATPDIDPGAASRLAEALGALAPAGPQAQRGAERVLALLATPDISHRDARELAAALRALAPGGPQAQRGAERVLELLATPHTTGWDARELTEALGALAPAGPNPQALAERVLEVLATPDIYPEVARELAAVLGALAPAGPDRQALIERVLELLTAPDIDPGAASRLARALGALAPAGPHAQRGAERVLELLATPDIGSAWELAAVLGALAPAGPDRQALIERVLELLAAPDIDPGAARGLAEALGGLRLHISYEQWSGALAVSARRRRPQRPCT